MAVITRETLVLRGVSVLCDGLVVVARLGTGYPSAAPQQTPAICFPMRHPQSFNPRNLSDSERWASPDDHRDASSRTGRSAAKTIGAFPRKPWTRGRFALACLPWQATQPGLAGRTTSTRTTRERLAGDRMS